MNLYEAIHSTEIDWGIILLGPGSLNFEEVNVSENEKNVIILDGSLYFSIPKTVKFELSEEDEHFLRFKIVGHKGGLSLHKKQKEN